jgi:hypothetical protein
VTNEWLKNVNGTLTRMRWHVADGDASTRAVRWADINNDVRSHRLRRALAALSGALLQCMPVRSRLDDVGCSCCRLRAAPVFMLALAVVVLWACVWMWTCVCLWAGILQGWLDLVVANENGPNLLYLNDASLQQVEVSGLNGGAVEVEGSYLTSTFTKLTAVGSVVSDDETSVDVAWGVRATPDATRCTRRAPHRAMRCAVVASALYRLVHRTTTTTAISTCLSPTEVSLPYTTPPPLTRTSSAISRQVRPRLLLMPTHVLAACRCQPIVESACCCEVVACCCGMAACCCEVSVLPSSSKARFAWLPP